VDATRRARHDDVSFSYGYGIDLSERDATLMSPAEGSATLCKFTVTAQNASTGTKGTNGGRRHPRFFFSYHISNIQRISVQQSSITL
jgi:hypothetical protein